MKGFKPWENINAAPNDMPHHDVHYRKKGNSCPSVQAGFGHLKISCHWQQYNTNNDDKITIFDIDLSNLTIDSTAKHTGAKRFTYHKNGCHGENSGH